MSVVRPSAPLLAALLVASVLAGCTGDGYLGEIDEGGQRAAAEQRSRELWRAPAASHSASTVVSGESLTVGEVAPFPIEGVDLSAGPILLDPRGAPDTFALHGARVDGERGWVVFDASRPSVIGDVLASESGGFRVSNATIVANASGTFARLGAGFADIELPTTPPALATTRHDDFPTLELPERVTLHVENATFYGVEGEPRAVPDGTEIDTRDAVLARLSDGSLGLTNALHLRLHDMTAFPWSGSVSVAAEMPRGALAFEDRTWSLDGTRSASLVARGAGVAQLHRTGAGWGLDPATLDLVDVQTDGVPRLGASLRLVPDLVELNGTAGNVSRVRLVLVETSGGANAHLTGYRIAGDVEARYVGYEPFQVTEEMLRIIRETPAPMTPFAAVGLGIAVPFVALVEGVFSIVTTFFPPSVAGTLDAGQGRLLTFDLQMPETARDVEILIEAANGEPARATLRLTPTSG